MSQINAVVMSVVYKGAHWGLFKQKPNLY